MAIAVTRPVSSSFGSCELTHLARVAIDVAVAARQHAAYEQALESAGCMVRRLPAEPQLPDAVFVEDAAVVLDEVAIVTRPGAASRRPEVESVAGALAAWRPVTRVAAPGTIDGGDVLRIGRRIWVGRSSRTNAAGFEQLRAAAEAHGYRVSAVEVRGCLHLKSAVTELDPETVLVNPAWIDADTFSGLRRVEIDASEPHAANVLRVAERLIYPAAFPRTAERLEKLGARLALVDVSEIAKAEGAVTCCSIIVG
jgi:dimethylargininase